MCFGVLHALATGEASHRPCVRRCADRHEAGFGNERFRIGHVAFVEFLGTAPIEEGIGKPAT